MKTTYLIETINKQVVGYENRLSDAKYIVKGLSPDLRDGCIIIKMIGPSFGEGWHVYKLIFRKNRFKYFWKNPSI